jgi:hypothetical protein
MADMNELTQQNDPRFQFDVRTVQGLDIEAFDRWLGYKKGRKQSYKTALSERAAAVKLSQMGEDQSEAVDESISNNWAGIFPLKKTLAPGEKPKKTKEQVQADVARDDWLMKQAQKGVDAAAQSPLGRLRLLDAVLARVTLREHVEPDVMETLRDRIATALSDCNPADAYNDPTVRSMVMQVWGARGVSRLQQRVQTARET